MEPMKDEKKRFSRHVNVLAVLLIAFVLTTTAVVSQSFDDGVDQGHPIYELDFGKGRANEDFDMGLNDIINVSDIYSELLNTTDVDAETVNTTDVIAETLNTTDIFAENVNATEVLTETLNATDIFSENISADFIESELINTSKIESEVLETEIINSSGTIEVESDIDMNGSKIKELPEPEEDDEAVNKEYLNETIENLSLDQTTSSCYDSGGSTASCTTSCPSGTVRTGCSAYEHKGRRKGLVGSEPSGSDGCECKTGSGLLRNARVDCYAYCVEVGD